MSLSSSLSTLSAEIESASVSVQPAAGTKKVPLKDIVSGAFSNVFGGGGNNQLAPFAQDVFSKTFQFEGSADMTLEKALISMNDPRVMDELVKAAQFVYMTGGGSPSTGDMSPEAAALWPYILEAIKQGKIRLSDDWSFLQVIDRGFDEGGFTQIRGLKDIAGVVHKMSMSSLRG